METCLEQLGSLAANEDLLLDQVRTEIRMRLPDGYPSLDQIADALRAPRGAMHREFHGAGLTYKEVVEDVRRRLAISYMKQRHLPFSEIAVLLGYSELSAFSRAFRRWTGASPREYRTRALDRKS